MDTQPRIIITNDDYQRLSALVSQMEGPVAEALDEELSRANVIADTEIPANVVKMNSKIKFIEETSGQESNVTLVYPEEANLGENKISVLAPVGAALIGLSVGQMIEWKMPSGANKKLKVISVD